MTVGSQMLELDWGLSPPPLNKIGSQNTPCKLGINVCQISKP